MFGEKIQKYVIFFSGYHVKTNNVYLPLDDDVNFDLS